MDGHEAIKQIKATAKGQATVIIALTASAFEEERAAILSEGCDDFLRKPFREAEIYDKLAQHLGVSFVYQEVERGDRDREQRQDAAGIPTRELSPTDMAGLPADWVTNLHQAAMQADIDLTLDLLDQIRRQDAPLANALASLVHDFRFDIIMALTVSTEDGYE
jgi:response regulator RpfG family c-di-GMP phosphodiesterase